MSRIKSQLGILAIGSLAAALALAGPAQAQFNFGNLFGGNSGGFGGNSGGSGGYSIRQSRQPTVRNPNLQSEVDGIWKQKQKQPDWGKMREQYGVGQRVPPPRPSTSRNSGSGWGNAVADALSNLPQNTARPSFSETTRPYYPQNTRPYYPQNNYAPRPQAAPRNNVVRPTRPVDAPRNSLPPKQTDPPKNDPRFSLTGAEEQATQNTADETDKLAEKAEDQLVNDPKLTDPAQGGKINGDRDVKDAVEKFKETGDSSELEDIMNDPATPDSVKEKIDIFISAEEASDLIGDGGLNTKGTDGRIDDLEDKITSSKNLTPDEKKTLLEQTGNMRESNDNRKVIDAIVAAGAGGTGGGGVNLGGIDMTTLDPSGPIFVEDPVADADNAAVSSGTLLVNPEENGESVSYLLANHPYTMAPGQSQPLDREYTIEFDRGGEFGSARYSLPAGTYEFILTDRGWDLRKKTYEATIDNSRYPGAFGYVLDNKQYTLQPGEKKTHTGAYPLSVVFDRGDGGEPARKQLTAGTYQVGLDAHEGRLDLFPDEGGNLLGVN